MDTFGSLSAPGLRRLRLVMFMPAL